MNNQKKISGWMIFSAIISSILFYVVLYLLARWFPEWANRTLQNEWVLVVISAIPIVVVLVFLIIERLTKAKIGDFEFEFGEGIPSALLRTADIDLELVKQYLSKQSERELDRLINDIKSRGLKPQILVVPLDRIGRRISFPVLKRYIYELSKAAPVKYVVYLDENNRYIGFETVDEFKSRFPAYGVEIIINDLRNEETATEIREFNFELFNNANSQRLSSLVTRLSSLQWGQNLENARVRVLDLDKLGATDLKAYSTFDPFSTLPKPEPTPIKTQITTEVTK